MPPNHDGRKSHIGAEIPTTWKSALVAVMTDRTTAHEQVSQSDLVREALKEWFRNHWEELPEEARDSLDFNLKSDGGPRLPPEHLRDGMQPVEIEEVDDADV